MVAKSLRKSEPVDQPMFSFPARSMLFTMALLFLIVVVARAAIDRLPDRRPGPQRTAAVRFAARAAPAGFNLWAVEVNDWRWAGASALVVDRGKLLTLTDSGVLAWLPLPGEGRRAVVRDLPDGPGPAMLKRNRDSEALGRLADGEWLVSFENRNQVWRYDARWRAGRRAIDLRSQGLGLNKGIEGLTVEPRDGTLRLFAEDAEWLMEHGTRFPLPGSRWSVSDATVLPDGRTLVLQRSVGLGGIGNALAWLEGAPGAKYRLRQFLRLPLGRLDNAEGLAAQLLPDGGTRLWIITDNDGSPFRETLLLSFRLPDEVDRNAERRRMSDRATPVG